MADATYQPKVYRKQGGDILVVANGGLVDIETGGDLKYNGTSLIDEIAALSGLDSGELGVLEGVVAGTVTASKVVVVGADKNVDVLAIADGGLSLGAGAGTAVTSTAAELNLLDGSIAGTAVASKALALGADKNVDVLAVADGGLSLGAGAGTAITSTAAELNILDGVTATAAEINSLDDSAAFADGLSRVRVATATYDFAVDGGAVSAIGLGVTLPDNAIMLDGMVDVVTTLTSAGDTATVAIHAESANDLVTAVAINDGGNPWDAGLHAIIPLGTAASAVKLTAAREITATIAVEDVTAGKFVVFVRYVLSA